MHSRRNFLTAAGAASVLPVLHGCAGAGMEEYEAAARHLREAISSGPDVLEFVRYATLAANGHNTQPWLFRAGPDRTSILPDLSRRTPVVDPDDHHLYVSLGCAAENFALAAAAHGRPAAVSFNPAGHGEIDIDLINGAAVESDLYPAIPARQSTRSVYDGREVSPDDLRKLEAAAAADGVDIALITGERELEQVLDFVVAGNSLQMDDPAFVEELKAWLRFNPDEAIRASDGLFSACSGNPTLPTWVGNIAFGQFFKKDAENEKYTEQMRSSAGVAVFTGAVADREHWIKVGRSFQRFALQATALGIRHAHINQPIEATAIRPDFASFLGARGARPDLVIRFGYAPALPMSMRRPVDAVLVGA